MNELEHYQQLLRLDAARAKHLMRMFSVADGQPFHGHEARLVELRIATKRIRQWERRIQELQMRPLRFS